MSTSTVKLRNGQELIISYECYLEGPLGKHLRQGMDPSGGIVKSADSEMTLATAVYELEARNATLEEMRLEPEDAASLKRQIDRYLSGRKTTTIVVKFAP